MSVADTLGERLPLEISRVRAIQDQMKELRGLPNVMVEPQIAMIEAEIDYAIKAMIRGDTVAMIRIYATLKEYRE